jgi:hypothetical protein
MWAAFGSPRAFRFNNQRAFQVSRLRFDVSATAASLSRLSQPQPLDFRVNIVDAKSLEI